MFKDAPNPELGIIRSTTLEFVDEHNLTNFCLDIDFGGHAQGFTGILGGKFTDVAIRGILRAVGVNRWEQLVGQHVWCYREPVSFPAGGARIVAIEVPRFHKHEGGPFNIVEAAEKLRKEKEL